MTLYDTLFEQPMFNPPQRCNFESLSSQIFLVVVGVMQAPPLDAQSCYLDYQHSTKQDKKNKNDYCTHQDLEISCYLNLVAI